jgi:adenylate kinase family enzyme
LYPQFLRKLKRAIVRLGEAAAPSLKRGLMTAIVSGPIGAGKTTVARALLDRLGNAVAYIEGDAFWPFIVKESPAQSPQQRFHMTMRAMLGAAWHYHRDNYTVIVDFSIPVGYLDAVKRLLRQEPFHFIVVMPSEPVCARRAAERAEGRIEDYTPYHDFYLEFFGVEDGTIEDDDASPDSIAATIYEGLASGRFLVNP